MVKPQQKHVGVTGQRLFQMVVEDSSRKVGQRNETQQASRNGADAFCRNDIVGKLPQRRTSFQESRIVHRDRLGTVAKSAKRLRKVSIAFGQSGHGDRIVVRIAQA